MFKISTNKLIFELDNKSYFNTIKVTLTCIKKKASSNNYYINHLKKRIVYSDHDY